MPDAARFGRVAARTIRYVRRYHEMSQEQLAENCGISAHHLGEVERGNKDPRLSTFADVVERGLGMELDEFMRLCLRVRAGDYPPDLRGIAFRDPVSRGAMPSDDPGIDAVGQSTSGRAG